MSTQYWVHRDHLLTFLSKAPFSTRNFSTNGKIDLLQKFTALKSSTENPEFII